VSAVSIKWWTSFDVTFFTSVATSFGLDADCGLLDPGATLSGSFCSGG
jgi:hypothetical protein